MSNDNLLSSWIGRPAFGPDGEEVGTVVDIYVDDATAQPEWLALRTAAGDGSFSFVPLAGADPRGDDVIIGYDKDRVIGAPTADPDGTLTLDEEAALYVHYGLAYSTSGSESGLPEQPAAASEMDAQPAAPRMRMRRRRDDEDFDMVRLASEDVPIVVKQKRSAGPR